MLMASKGPITILIPDGESNHVPNVLRCLALIKGLRIIVLSPVKNNPVRYMSNVDTFIHEPLAASSGHFIELINYIATRYSIDVVMPVQAWAIRKLTEYRHLLFHELRSLLPASTHFFDLAQDKELLSEHLKRLGIPHPCSWSLDTGLPTKKDLQSMRFPLLLKPRIGVGGGIGIFRFDNEKDLQDHLANNNLKESYYLQEFVEGTDLGCNVLCQNGKIMACTIQLGTLFHNQPYKPQIGLRMIREENVAKSISRLMESLDWNGVAHIDLLYNIKTGEYSVLEINPRYWLTLHASCLAGVNFPWLYCQAALDHPFDFPEYRETEYLTTDGLKRRIRENPTLLFKMDYLLSHTPIKSMLKEPRWLAHFCLQKIRSLTKI